MVAVARALLPCHSQAAPALAGERHAPVFRTSAGHRATICARVRGPTFRSAAGGDT